MLVRGMTGVGEGHGWCWGPWLMCGGVGGGMTNVGGSHG